MVDITSMENHEKLQTVLNKLSAAKSKIPCVDIWAGFSREAREICESSDLMKVEKKD